MYAAVFATGQGLVAGGLEKAVSVIIEKIVSAAMGATLAGIAQQETAIALGDQKEFSWTAVGLGALTSAVTAGFSNGLGIDAAKKATDFGSYAHKLVQNIELTIAIQGLSFATGQQNHFSWREALASLASTIANVSVNQLDMDSEALSDALTTTSATMATLGVSKIIGGDFNLEATIANTLGTVIGNQVAHQAKQHYTEYQAESRQAAEFKHELADLTDDFMQSVKYRPDEHGVFSSTNTPIASLSSKPSLAIKTPKPAPQRATAHDALHRNAHLQKDHDKQEARMTRMAQRADARNRITGSGYGFWDKRGGSTSFRDMLGDVVKDMAIHAAVCGVTEEVNAAIGLIRRVAPVANEIFNPYVSIPRIPGNANEAIAAFRAGELGHGLVATGKVALDVAPLAGPLISGAAKGLSLVSKLGKIAVKGRKIEEYSFKAGQAEVHFQKHLKQFEDVFGFKNYSVENYVNDANLVIRNGTYSAELHAYIAVAGGKGGAKAIIAGLDRTTNDLTTLHLKPISDLQKFIPNFSWTARVKPSLTDLVGPNKELGWKSPYERFGL